MRLVDHDPRIGEQRVRLPLTGTPPLPLGDRADRDLFGQDYARQDDPAEPGSAGPGSPGGIPAGLMAGFVVAIWALWAVYAWRC